MSVRLACALRVFAGGSVYDLMSNYGISHTDVMDSVWHVVHAVNNLPEFKIECNPNPNPNPNLNIFDEEIYQAKMCLVETPQF